MKKIYTLFPAIAGWLFAVNAQGVGDYRSAASGNWSDASSWQRFNGAWVAAPSAPASSDGVISILTGHIITINSTVTADQVVVNAGGTLTQESDLNLDNGTGNDLTVNGTWNFSNGILGGPGNAIVAAAGTITLATAGNKLIGTAITNNGIINWQEGSLFFNAAINVTNNGTMNISGNNGFQNNAGSGSFINTGTVTKTSTGTTLFTIETVSNSGTINVNGGSFDLGNSFTNSGNLTFNSGTWNQNIGTFSHNAGSVINGTGSFNNGSGATLDLNSNQVFPSTLIFSNTGTISGAGNLTINNAFTIDGTIGGAGSLTINANSTWNSGVLSRALIIPPTRTLNLATAGNKLIGAAITNNGIINWQDGSLFFNAVTTLTNNGAMNISGNNGFQNNAESGSFINTGTVTKTSTGTTLFTINTVSNSGSINLNGGSFDLNNSFTNTGNLTFNSGTWNQSGSTFSHNAGSVINGTGSFNNSTGATLDLNSNQIFPATLVFSNTGTISGSGNLTINNPFTIEGTIGGSGNLIINANSTWNSGGLNRALTIGATGILTLATNGNKFIGAAITNNGTINWQEGSLYFDAATTLTNNATMNISGNDGFQNNAATGSFINTGTVTKTSTGTTLFTINAVSNSGTINLNGGSFDLGNNFTNTGNLIFNSGTWNQTTATFSHNAGSVINGTGSFNNGTGATLDLNSNQVFPSTLVFSNAGTISGSGNLTINNPFTIEGTIGGAGSLIINANSTWNSGELNRALTIAATGTLQLTTTDNKLIGAAITSNGILNWQAGGLYFNASVTVTNNGTMNISGNGDFQNNSGTGVFVNNGTITKSSTGTTIFGMSTITNSTGAIIKGLGTLDITAATFNSNGFIAPGLSPGLLTITTRQPLSANSTLNIEMLNGSGAGTGHDQLVRDGLITLAGTLTVTETGTVPNGTYTIINLTSGTVSGSFATTNLPSGYTIQTNASDVRVIRNISLPLNLISFTAQKTSGSKINLRWVTMDEHNVSHFEVQRSSNGVDYTRIAIVQALNSPIGGTYSCRDDAPHAKDNYYRLRMVDLDASYQLSLVRRVSVDKEKYSLSIYPNPATHFVQVDFSSSEKKIQVNIFDAYGKLMLSNQMNNDLLIKIPIQSLTPGTYYLQVSDGSQKATRPFVKL